MKNRILSLVMACALFCTVVFSDISVFAENAETMAPDTAYINASGLIKAICPDFPLADNKNTTRAEFVAGIVKLLNADYKNPEAQPYNDVHAEHEFAPEIAFAKDLGLISSADNFNPDNSITYSEALKIVVCAVGYGDKAEYTGGYPAAYLKIAGELDLTDGVVLNNDNTLSHKDSTLLIFNAVQTDIAEQTSFGSNTEYTKIEGRNILSVYHDILSQEGLIDANEFTGLKGISTSVGDSAIAMGKTTFYGDGFDELLGRNSKVFYYNDNKRTIVYAYAKDNIEYSYTSEDTLILSGFTITVQTGESIKEKRHNLDSEYGLIYNGKYLSAYDYSTYLNPESGLITLVDYDGAGIDVIIVKSIEYGVVGSVNIIDETIYDAHKKNGTINLGAADYYNIKDSEGFSITIRDLQADDAIGIVKSSDGKRVEIIKYTKKISGIFESKDSDGNLYIADEKYTLSKYYKDNVKSINSLKLNAELMASVGEGNSIIYIEEFDSGINYGYVVEVGTLNQGSISEEKVVRLFGSNGKMNTYPISDKIKINGVSVTESAALAELALIADKMQPEASPAQFDYLWRIVKYSLNSKEELISIWTTADDKVTKSQTTDIYTTDELKNQISLVYDNEITADSRPLLFDDNTAHTGGDGKVLYAEGIFYPFFRPADDAVILRVPSVVRAADPANQKNDWKDEKNYKLSSVSEIAQYASSSQNVTCYAYDVDKEGAHLIVWIDDSASASTVSTEGRSGIVEEITVGVNPEGEQVTVIKMYYNDVWEKLYAMPENEFTAASASSKNLLYGANKVKPGDIINISLNSDKEIVAVDLDFTFLGGKQFTNTSYNVDANGVAKYDSELRGYFSGYVFALDGANAMLVCGRDDTQMANGNFGVVHMKPANLGSGKVVYVKFDRDRNSAIVYKEADTSMVESYYTSGMNADYVVVRSRWYETSLTIIYTN